MKMNLPHFAAVKHVFIFIDRCIFSASDTGILEKWKTNSVKKKKPVTSDALSLSNKRLVGAKNIKLGLCDKHPAYIVGLLLF